MSLLFTIPKEVLEICLSNLDIDDVLNVTQTCTTLKNNLENGDLWRSYLSRLETLDPFPVAPTNYISGRLTCIDAFKKINQKQQEEIQHFIDFVKNISSPNPHEKEALQARLLGMKVCAKTLSELEERDALLNNLNIDLLKIVINRAKYTNPTVLIADNFSITRFPDKLLNDPGLLPYWQNMEYINLNNNKLHSLPNSLENCAKLKRLNCQNNQLKTLPDSIGKCTELKYLICCDNQLEALPNTLGNCNSLVSLICSNNKIRKLPETLYNCLKLRFLSFSNNRIRFINPNFNWKLKNFTSHGNNISLEQDLILWWLEDKFSAILLIGMLSLWMTATLMTLPLALLLIPFGAFYDYLIVYQQDKILNLRFILNYFYTSIQQPMSHPLVSSILSITLLHLMSLFVIQTIEVYLTASFLLFTVSIAITGLMNLSNYLAYDALNKQTDITETAPTTFSNDLNTQKAFEDGCSAGRSWTSYFKTYCSVNNWRHPIACRAGIINTYQENDKLYVRPSAA